MGRRISLIENNRKLVRQTLQSTGQFRNVIKASKGLSEGLSHKIVKFWITTWLDEHHIDYYTEGSLRATNGRIDVIVENWAIILEVLSSETRAKFLKKAYPLPTIPVTTGTSCKELFVMLQELFNTNGTVADYYVKKYVTALDDWTPIKQQKNIADLMPEGFM